MFFDRTILDVMLFFICSTFFLKECSNTQYIFDTTVMDVFLGIVIALNFFKLKYWQSILFLNTGIIDQMYASIDATYHVGILFRSSRPEVSLKNFAKFKLCQSLFFNKVKLKLSVNF